MRTALALCFALLAACSDDTDGVPFDGGPDFGSLDAGGSDFGTEPDAFILGELGVDTDAFVPEDLGADPDMFVVEDGGTSDAAMAMGFGTIAGPCGRLDTELTSAEPFLFETRLDFMMDPYTDPDDFSLLTAGAQTILTEGTAGGSSGLSEAFAFEVLARCEGATLVKTETFINYMPGYTGTITDILVMIGTEKIGVSVTRAFVFPPSDPYPVSRATDLLTDKLADVLESSAGVRSDDAWTKQILAVVAYGTMHAESIATAWASLDPSLRADTIVYVIVTDGDDDPLY
ncbi:MAG: hypothetical protein JJ863_00145 [Deltaproteobacteria bacterium]|nr:hypothetical protein [Deltaproteobacteria bacterium]